MPSTVAELEARAKRLETAVQPYRYHRPGLLAFLAGGQPADPEQPPKAEPVVSRPGGNRAQRRARARRGKR